MFYLMMALSASCLLSACHQRGRPPGRELKNVTDLTDKKCEKLPKAEDLGIFNGGKSYFPQYLLRVNDLTFCHSDQDRWTHRHSKANQHAFNNDAVICL